MQKAVIDLARLHGYRVVHFPKAQGGRDGRWMTAVAGDAKGWPDLTCVSEKRIVFLEIKSQRGALSPEQKEWASILQCLELSRLATYMVVRPKDYPDKVQEVLK